MLFFANRYEIAKIVQIVQIVQIRVKKWTLLKKRQKNLVLHKLLLKNRRYWVISSLFANLPLHSFLHKLHIVLNYDYVNISHKIRKGQQVKYPN